MKLSRKLIPAMIMLLVSAVLMSTASFAWFSTNVTATATDMSVQIAAAKNLLIAEGESTSATGFAASVDLDVEETAMIPASTALAATPAFYYVSSAGGIAPDNYEAGTNTTFALSDDGKDAEDAKTVFVHKTVSIMATGEYESGQTHGNIVANVAATGNGVTSDVAPCLRVMLVVDGTTPIIYAPLHSNPTAYQPVTGTTSEDLGTEISTFGSNTTVLVTGIQKDVAHQVDIYIWYEGQDTVCTAANAIDLGAIAIAITFGFAATGN